MKTLKLLLSTILMIIFLTGLSLYPFMSLKGQSSSNKVVYQIAKSGDGNIIAVTYRLNSILSTNVELYSSLDGKLIEIVDLSPSIPFIIALSPSGDRIVHTSSDGEIHIFDVTTHTDTKLLGGSPVTIADLKWNRNTDEIAYVMGSGIQIISAIDGSFIRYIKAGIPPVVTVDWSPNGTYFATSHFQLDPFGSETESVSVKIWELSSNEDPVTSPIYTLLNEGGSDIDWSPSGNQLALLGKNKLLVFDTETGQIVADISFDEEYPMTVAWSPSGNQIATGGKIIRIWNTTTWQVVKTIDTEGSTNTIQWSKNGNFLFNEGGTDGLYWGIISLSTVLPT